MYRFYRLASSLAELALRRRYPERFPEPPEAEVEVWMHAASVGESRVAAAIIRRLFTRRPETRLLLTLQTRTGLSEARRVLADLEGVHLALAPWDGPRTIRGFVGRLRPRVLALIETELWPNLIVESAGGGPAVLILNGRLSERSFPRYRLLKPLFRPVLERVTFAGVISEEDRKRFLGLGLSEDRVAVMGNAKHDLSFERMEKLDPVPLVRRLGLSLGEKLLVFGSVRGGEEDVVAEIIAGLLSESGLRFVVVPRHPERAPAFYRRFEGLGESVSFFSGEDLTRARIVVVDEVGPLFGLYALAEAAVIGGSFVPKGGQNPVEAAVLGKPILFGPHMENFRPEAETLVSGGGAVRVSSPAEAIPILRDWLCHPERARHTGRLAFAAATRLRGAADRYAELLVRFL